MSAPTIVEVIDGVLVRHRLDSVGNNLTCELRWCDTHQEPVWVYGDGSFSCPHEVTVGWASDGGHRILSFPAIAATVTP